MPANLIHTGRQRVLQAPNLSKFDTRATTHGGEAPPVGRDAERALLLGSFRLELREAMD